jgi:23S rRNA pseudouridine1911/1915/1917 synthase
VTSTAQKVTFEVAADDAGLRLDQLLAKRVDGLSRRKARVLLDIGGVFVDRARCKVASRQVRPGQVVEAHLGGALDRATKAVGGAARSRDQRRLPAFSIVRIDDDVVVVDKPAGLLTAPTPESDRGNLADALARQLDTPRRPAPIFVVHRLDLGTSGLLVFARTEEANRALSERFRVHDVRREYLAVVAGALQGDALTVDAPIAGRRAVTHLTVLERLGDDATVLRARLETGRTHQIRLHCRDLGHPVLGDRRYGEATPLDPPRMALHATRLGFAHPRTGEAVDDESPLPAELSGWLDDLRRSYA